MTAPTPAGPDDTPCADCGHVWFAGERRHVRVDGRGQAAADDADGDVVCLLCQGARARAATHGEDEPSASRWTWG